MNPIRKIYSLIRKRHLNRQGWNVYYYDLFISSFKKAYRSSDLPRKEKKWAYDRGFYPWHIQQYGLTEDNYRDIISDRDYAYLEPINQSGRKWINEKLTYRYVFAPFAQYLPKYYYHLQHGRDFMRLMDCPQTYGHSVEDVLALLKAETALIAKKIDGSRGEGFYLLEYKDGEIFVNKKTRTEEEFCRLIRSLNGYVITECVRMHPDLAKIYPDAVNTIRIAVINQNGSTPILPFAYFRIGTSRSGVVDNVSRGGMVCKIDVETGRYYDAQVLRDHVYENVECHPDTHVRMEGIIPHWDLVKKIILAMAEYCPQIKWFGFDVAITADGFKLIEVNSHQDLHKAHEYPPEVNQFLFSELEKKKKRYGLQ